MFTLKFETENAAFSCGNGPAEVARILARVSGYVDEGYAQGPVCDINGNKIGEWSCDLLGTDEEEP